MKNHRLIITFLWLVVGFVVALQKNNSGLGWPKLDYLPCLYWPAPPFPYIKCKKHVGQNASRALDAFRRNENNTEIEIVELYNLDDMTDDILQEITDIIANAASDRMINIQQITLPKVEKVPRNLQRFTNLQYFMFTNNGIKTLTAGSLAFSSNGLAEIQFYDNRNLEVIEPGAFQGNFNGTTIYLYRNNLKEFDERVFEPLLSDSTATIDVDQS